MECQCEDLVMLSIRYLVIRRML